MVHIGKYKEIVKKLIVEAEIEEDWKTATNLYGEKTAKRLKKLTPTFPFLLYDISFMSLVDEGKSKKEARTVLDSYKEEVFLHTLI